MCYERLKLIKSPTIGLGLSVIQRLQTPPFTALFSDEFFTFFFRFFIPYRSRSSCKAVHLSVSSSVGPDATAAGIFCDSRGSRTDARPCASSRAAPALPSV